MPASSQATAQNTRAQDHPAEAPALNCAVIYCRVSSTKQKKTGTGLDTQETRCREYAKAKGYPVVAVFSDDKTGAVTDRPGMKAMLGFLRQNRAHPHRVIIDDISRLARGLDAHLELRMKIEKAGGLLESPTLEFGADSDSMLVEHLLASVSQHHRQKNAEQVRNRVRARIMNGYWTYRAPPGYRYKAQKDCGKVLVRDESLASVVQEALEGFACGRFASQAEVQRFLQHSNIYPKNREGIVRIQRVTDLLTRALYAGYIDLPNKGISMVEGNHPALIDFTTFQKIQERLNTKPKICARKDEHEAFPLRGFISCGDCGKPYTGAFSKGRHQRYPYYFCFQRGCPSYRKSVRRETVHEGFEAIVETLQPSKALLSVAVQMFAELWNGRQDQNAARAEALKKDQANVERQVAQLLDRIVDADSASVIAAYEKRIHALEAQKVELSECIFSLSQNMASPKVPFEKTFRTALAFLANPQKLWASDQLSYKRTLLKLAFLDRPAYDRKTGFRTADFSIPFKVLSGKNLPGSQMVRSTGPELNQLFDVLAGWNRKLVALNFYEKPDDLEPSL